MLVENTDFKCTGTPTICYGVGHTIDQFKALQATLNRFAAQLGFAPLTIDGLIGDNTLTAATAAAISIGQAGPTNMAALAANADVLTTQLSAALTTDGAADVTSTAQQIVAACDADINGDVCGRAKAMCKYVAGTDQEGLPGIADVCYAASGRKKWALGFGIGLAALGVVGAILLVRRRRTDAHALAGVSDPTWVEERRPGNPGTFIRAGFRQIPCADEATETVMRCWTKVPE